MNRILRAAALTALALLLAGCVSLGGFKPPASTGKAAEPAASPQQCPGSLRAAVPRRPELPPGAGFPRPETDEEKAAFAPYGEWLGALGQWGRTLSARAAEAKEFCDRLAK